MCFTGVAAITLVRCRGSGYITLNGCPTGQVISVQSADVALNVLESPRGGTCSWNTDICRGSIITREAITNCNGQRTCSFNQTVFLYPQGTASTWCRLGNIIKIEYNCITSTCKEICQSFDSQYAVLFLSLGRLHNIAIAVDISYCVMKSIFPLLSYIRYVQSVQLDY